jgi:hypothetical protein
MVQLGLKEHTTRMRIKLARCFKDLIIAEMMQYLFCKFFDSPILNLMKTAMCQRQLIALGYHQLLKSSATITDVAGSEAIN